MAKRFTDTDKWKKHFIKSLPTEYKLFWIFILDECDNAGIWHVELEIAEARLGIKLSLEKIRGFFKERIVEFDNGTKMFIPDFVQFQYGSLNEANNAHKSVIDKLFKYNLLGLMSPSQGAMDKDKEKDMVKDKAIGSEKIKEIANNVWDDQGWKEQICMGNDMTVPNLKTWMAKFNASVMNDTIPDFSEKTYKKMFQGWVSLQKSKGVKIGDPITPVYDANGHLKKG